MAAMPEILWDKEAIGIVLLAMMGSKPSSVASSLQWASLVLRW